jgi:hypothetical protein
MFAPTSLQGTSLAWGRSLQLLLTAVDSSTGLQKRCASTLLAGLNLVEPCWDAEAENGTERPPSATNSETASTLVCEISPERFGTASFSSFS